MDNPKHKKALFFFLFLFLRPYSCIKMMSLNFIFKRIESDKSIITNNDKCECFVKHVGVMLHREGENEVAPYQAELRRRGRREEERKEAEA